MKTECLMVVLISVFCLFNSSCLTPKPDPPSPVSDPCILAALSLAAAVDLSFTTGANTNCQEALDDWCDCTETSDVVPEGSPYDETCICPATMINVEACPEFLNVIEYCYGACMQVFTTASEQDYVAANWACQRSHKARTI